MQKERNIMRIDANQKLTNIILDGNRVRKNTSSTDVSVKHDIFELSNDEQRMLDEIAMSEHKSSNNKDSVGKTIDSTELETKKLSKYVGPKPLAK